jgi:hypothetical protein
MLGLRKNAKLPKLLVEFQHEALTRVLIEAKYWSSIS